MLHAYPIRSLKWNEITSALLLLLFGNEFAAMNQMYVGDVFMKTSLLLEYQTPVCNHKLWQEKKKNKRSEGK